MKCLTAVMALLLIFGNSHPASAQSVIDSTQIKSAKIFDSIRVVTMTTNDSLTAIEDIKDRKHDLSIRVRARCSGRRSFSCGRRLEQIIELYPTATQYDDVIVQLASESIWIGETQQQLLVSMGRPTSINSTVTAYGTHSQWVYNHRYAYLENGIVTSYQE